MVICHLTCPRGSASNEGCHGEPRTGVLGVQSKCDFLPASRDTAECEDPGFGKQQAGHVSVDSGAEPRSLRRRADGSSLFPWGSLARKAAGAPGKTDRRPAGCFGESRARGVAGSVGVGADPRCREMRKSCVGFWDADGCLSIEMSGSA